MFLVREKDNDLSFSFASFSAIDGSLTVSRQVPSVERLDVLRHLQHRGLVSELRCHLSDGSTIRPFVFYSGGHAPHCIHYVFQAKTKIIEYIIQQFNNDTSTVLQSPIWPIKPFNLFNSYYRMSSYQQGACGVIIME